MSETQSTRIHKKIRFTGDYSQLKSMGYSFQKLYAGNYMQWANESTEHLCSTRVWKKGAEVTIDELTNYEGFFFDELLKLKATGKKLPITNFGLIEFIACPVTREISFDQKDMEDYTKEEDRLRDLRDQLNKAFPMPDEIRNLKGVAPQERIDWFQKQKELGKTKGIILNEQCPRTRKKLRHICPTDLKPLLELMKLGWVEVKEYKVKAN